MSGDTKLELWDSINSDTAKISISRVSLPGGGCFRHASRFKCNICETFDSHTNEQTSNTDIVFAKNANNFDISWFTELATDNKTNGKMNNLTPEFSS